MALALILALNAPLLGQSWEDQSQAQSMNFDKLLVGTDKMIVVGPPEGKYWILLRGLPLHDMRPMRQTGDLRPHRGQRPIGRLP